MTITTLLSLEKTLELLGAADLPGDMEELRRYTTDLVNEKGEEWVSKHRQLLVDQWMMF
jgi:hypothetical protein